MRSSAVAGMVFSPVTRTVPNGKAYDRNRVKREDRELVRQISGLCNNANQLAHRANSTGVAGQQSVDEMTRVAKEVWREIKENY